MKEATLSIDDLVRHELHSSLYDSAGDVYEESLAELKESIERVGQLTPIAVLPDKRTVVDGCRRLEAMKAAGLKQVRAVVRTDLQDDLDVRQAVIEYNRQRVKTKSERANERIALANILAERAKRASLANLKNQEADEPERTATGRSRTDAARLLGDNRSDNTLATEDSLMSEINKLLQSGDKSQVRKGKKLQARFDKGESARKLLEEARGRQKKQRGGKAGAGKGSAKNLLTPEQEADALAALAVLKKLPRLDGMPRLSDIEDAINGAGRKIEAKRDQLKRPIPTTLLPLFNDGDFAKAVYHLMEAKKIIKSKRGVVAMWLESGSILEAIDDAKSKVEDACVKVVCPACDGGGCVECRKTGAMPAWAYTTWKAEQGCKGGER